MGKRGPGNPKARAAAPRRLIVQQEFLDDLQWWIRTDPRIALRILQLIEEISRAPFSGIGKPEPLKYLPGHPWSRRITQEHRLVYRVTDSAVDLLQARYHY